MVRVTKARIDLDALKHNFRAIQQYLSRNAPDGKTPGIIAVVKANAYGHGAERVAIALEHAGATMLACADIEEGIALRGAGVHVPILVFGALSVSNLDGLFEFSLTPTISTPSAARAVQAAAATRNITIGYHLKVDTGMNRLGFRHDNLRRTLPELFASANLRLEAVYTHFATADDPDSKVFDDQRTRFENALITIQQLSGSAKALPYNQRPEAPSPKVAQRFGAAGDHERPEAPSPKVAQRFSAVGDHERAEAPPAKVAQRSSAAGDHERAEAPPPKVAQRFSAADDHERAEAPSPKVAQRFSAADDHERAEAPSPKVAQRFSAAGILCHAANSAAILRDSRVWYDVVRPGLLLYGIVPPPLASTIPLEPVMSLTSRVVAVKGLRPGEGVGYGLRYRADHPSSIAVIPAGYADGLDTRLSGRSWVLIRGQRVPIVGSVCMDMMMADVTGLAVEPGDEVVIIGKQGTESWQRLDAREMAAAIGTIPWEIVCRIGTRIERQYD